MIEVETLMETEAFEVINEERGRLSMSSATQLVVGKSFPWHRTHTFAGYMRRTIENRKQHEAN